MLQHSLVELIK